MPEPIKELEQAKAELAAMKAAQDQAALDEAAAIERVSLSYGALTIEQARQVIKYQRDWEKSPNHPDNLAKAAAKAGAK